MFAIKKILPFLSIVCAAFSVYVMITTPRIPPYQIILYTMAIVIPCGLILFWKTFDLTFGFAPPKATREDTWSSITPWVGWIVLTAMILMNHFARPPADF